MEDKLKRECKTYVEKEFRKFEKFSSGAMMKDDVKVLLKKVIPDYDIQENEEELNELLGQYLKASKYTVQNPQTKKMEVKLLEGTVDFPSVLAITVHYLKKIECNCKEINPFADRQMVKVNNLVPIAGERKLSVQETKIKKKMF